MSTFAICGEAQLSYSDGTSPVSAAGELGDVLPLSDVCGEGQQALGGVEGSNGSVRILETQSSDAGMGWSSTVQNFGDEAASGTGWRSCTTDYLPTRRQDFVTLRPGERAKVIAHCESDEVVITGGLDFIVAGETHRDAWATATRPYDSKDNKKTPEDGWLVKAYNDGDTKGKLMSLALCVPR